jgi:hypothetical protein
MISNHEAVKVLSDWLAPIEQDDCILLNTLLVYPSNGVARISVQPMLVQERNFRVSDCGGAYNCIASSGAFDADIVKALRNFSKGTDTMVSENGAIFMDRVEAKELTAAASIVAERSVEAARHLIKKLRPLLSVDFRPQFNRWVEETFKNKFDHNPKLPGASNKIHRFDYQIRFGDNLMLLDAVRPDHASIASKVVAHLDLANRHERFIKQAIVYDADDDWNSADLSLLRVGATPVEFASIGRYISETV